MRITSIDILKAPPEYSQNISYPFYSTVRHAKNMGCGILFNKGYHMDSTQFVLEIHNDDTWVEMTTDLHYDLIEIDRQFNSTGK